MIDDWGDKAGNYYARRDPAIIKGAADKTRTLIRQKIGLFQEFEEAYKVQQKIVNQMKAPGQEMSPREFTQAQFYGHVAVSHDTLPVQWERGDYKSAEQSFLRINRSGQPLDPWEATLIEHRNSSYARCIMSIASGGESGHYWPEPSTENDGLLELVKSFGEKAASIHKRLFVPPFRLPVTSLNVPFMVAPAYFQKHKYLIEIIPLIVEREIATTEEQQVSILERDATATAETVIQNANRILSSMEGNLDHFVSPSHNSKSLSIIPLFYWYNQKAQYARGLFYGFVYWMLTGSEQDILNRKLVFSANRDRFEHALFHLKREIATLQEKGGAGLHATKRVADFFQAFLESLHNQPEIKIGSELLDTVMEILRPRARISVRGQKPKSSRAYSKRDKSQINIKELFENSVPCYICGGLVNLQQGLQYDHTEDYATSGLTDPETGKPTHPFCNLHKKKIQAYRAKKSGVQLPSFVAALEREKKSSAQLTLPGFLGDDNFPG